MCNDYLKTYPEKYEQIIIVDIRDMIFQDNCFKYYDKFKNYLGYATEYKNIKDELTSNVPWLYRLIGEEETKKFWDKKIVCAGTIWGTTKEMIVMLTAMEDVFNKYGTFWGADQAAEMYVIHTNLVDVKNLVESDVNTGAIFTNGLIHTEIKDNKILNLSGNVPAIVHQYDRHADQVALVDKLYRLENLEYDDKYKDTKSILDMINSMIYREEIQKAFNKILYLLDNVSNNELKFEWNRISRLIIYLNKIKFDSTNVEFLGYAICKLMMKALNAGAEINFKTIEDMWTIYAIIKNKTNATYKPFENVMGQIIWQVIKFMEQNKNMQAASMWFERLKLTDYKLH